MRNTGSRRAAVRAPFWAISSVFPITHPSSLRRLPLRPLRVATAWVERGEKPAQRRLIQAHGGDATLAHRLLRRLQDALQDSQRNTSVRSPIRSSLLVLASLAVAVMLLAGCGGGGGEDPQKVLQQTFSGNKKVTSGKLDLSLTVTADGVQNVNGPISLSLTGPFQSQGPNTLPK